VITLLGCLGFVAIVVLFAGLPLAHWSHQLWRLR
jgi:hypothetical protein